MISIIDVAKYANVSSSTVSKVINKYPGVSEGTRNKVNQAIAILNYSPNVVARGLVTKRSWTIGILFYNILTNPFVSELLAGIQKVVESTGYDLIFISAKYNEPDYSIIAHCKSRNVDGMIVFGIDRVHCIVKDLIDSEIPTIFIDDDIVGRRAGYVTADNRKGIVLAIEHLYELGHRKIAYISGVLGYLAGRQRFEGYQQGLRYFGLPFNGDFVVSSNNYDVEGGYQAMKRLLQVKDLPTAVICVSDLVAIGAIDAIQEIGLEVADDVSVVGFDNNYITTVYRPGLTTINQNVQTMGEKAAEWLFHIIDNPDSMPPCHIEPVELIIRNSSKAPK